MRHNAPLTRISFLAHEPAAGHRGAARGLCGGAGYAVAEQAAAVERFRMRVPGGQDSARLVVLSPRVRGKALVPAPAATQVFDVPDQSLDDLATRLVDDEAWLSRLRDLLGSAPVLAHHLPAALVAQRLGLPTLCTLHSLWPSVRAALTGEAQGPRSAACGRLLEEVDGVIVATRAEREWLLRTAPAGAMAKGLAQRVHVVSQGASPFLTRLAQRPDRVARRKAWRKRLLPTAGEQDVVLYMVGRLVPYKRMLEVIESFVRVAGQNPRAHLLVVGPVTDPAYGDRCAQAIRATPASVARRIALVGAQRIEAAPLAGDVLVHGSCVESWGRALDEALLFGLPAVLAASPFLAERVDRPWPAVSGESSGRVDRALWMDFGNPLALDDALRRALTDDGWRRTCGAFHRQRAACLNWEGPVRELLKVWNQLEIAQGHPAPFALGDLTVRA